MKPFYLQFREELNDFWEYFNNNDYWDEVDKYSVLDRLNNYLRESYWAEGCENEQSIKKRICEVAHYSPILCFTPNEDDIILLEASFYAEGECSFVAFAVHGCGFTIDFAQHLAARDTSYDIAKAV